MQYHPLFLVEFLVFFWIFTHSNPLSLFHRDALVTNKISDQIKRGMTEKNIEAFFKKSSSVSFVGPIFIENDKNNLVNKTKGWKGSNATVYVEFDNNNYVVNYYYVKNITLPPQVLPPQSGRWNCLVVLNEKARKEERVESRSGAVV